MTTFQPSIFDADRAEPRIGRARKSDPMTSKLAGEGSANRMRWNSSRHLLLQEFFCDFDGLTYEEAGLAIGLNNVQATRRCSELKRDGLIIETEETRKTSSGCKASVYVITYAGAMAIKTMKPGAA
jgi:hypothetical protein